MSGRYPALTDELARQLSDVQPSDGLYHPCKVTLHDGTVKDCVYIAAASPWYQLWGVWPEEDAGKHSVDVRAVKSIEDSPSRLPVNFANKLYQEGETGMGYTIFTVRFRDGSSIAVLTGNAVDFVDYPEGQSPETVSDVLPHAGRDDPKRPVPEYYWCLFDGLNHLS